MSAWWLLPAYLVGVMTLPLLLLALHEFLLHCDDRLEE
jgi:hypothetical protein